MQAGGGTLWNDGTLALPWGNARYEWPGLTLEAAGSVTTITAEGSEEAAPFWEVFWTAESFFAVQAGGPDLVIAPRGGELVRMADVVPRGEPGRYDSGLHAVRFYPVSDDECVLVTEIGVCRLSALSGVRWEYVHDDPSNRCLAVTPTTVELKGQHHAISIDTNTGVARTRSVRRQMPSPESYSRVPPRTG